MNNQMEKKMETDIMETAMYRYIYIFIDRGLCGGLQVAILEMLHPRQLYKLSSCAT